MAARTGGGPCKYRLLFAFIMLSNVSLSTSVSLDLTELRNKVSKIKVHPRGNLWATGHFMGKKSISNSQLQDTSLSSESMRTIEQQSVSPDGETEDLSELITQEVLKVALQAKLQDRKGTQDAYNQDSDFLIKLLKNYTAKRNL
ncbi:Neuromedin-B Neuromedin-B-32 [Triplophysa tibetana]|uniref:Neuromedin-B Neuromedin-B-32 n=1 Tax=Triplophysa tibetana TaxID=1572043 RepID=A0A5A9NZ42_9TELE|nr:Neuromedin-B Neuromedin-B-32 [Triplophysa tibetana]